MKTPLDPSECAMRLACNDATPDDMAVLRGRNTDASPERNALEFLAAAHAQLKHAAASINAVRENCEQHRAYAHMMQEQRAQIAEYCRTLEKQIEALRPSSPNIRDEPRAKRVGSGPWLGASGASPTQDAEPTRQANDHP